MGMFLFLLEMHWTTKCCSSWNWNFWRLGILDGPQTINVRRQKGTYIPKRRLWGHTNKICSNLKTLLRINLPNNSSFKKQRKKIRKIPEPWVLHPLVFHWLLITHFVVTARHHKVPILSTVLLLGHLF